MKKLVVFYDNYCPRCISFSTIIMKLDLFNLIIFEKLRDENLIYRYPDLDFSKALIGMASYNGK